MIEALCKRPFAVILVTIALLACGTIALLRLPLQAMPELSIPQLSVVTEFDGMPASELETLVALPLEQALSAVHGIKTLSTVIEDGLCLHSLRCEWGSNPAQTAVEVREAIDGVFPALPWGCQKPVVFARDLAQAPFMTVSIRPLGDVSLQAASDLVRNDIMPFLRRTQGIAEVRCLGLAEPELRIIPNPDKLLQAGLTLPDLAATLSQAAAEQPLGLVDEGPRSLEVIGGNLLESIKDIQNIAVGRSAMPLERVARVELQEKPRETWFLDGSGHAIGLELYRSADAGQLQTAAEARKLMALINSRHQGRLDLQILSDDSLDLSAAVTSLLVSLLIGLVAATAVLYPLYRNVVCCLIVTSAIPVCLAAVFLFCWFCGLSLNLGSLTGLAMGLGMAVDAMIVALERLLRLPDLKPASAAAETKRLMGVSAGSAITSIMVILPVLFVPGLVGALFRDLVLSLCAMTIASWLASLLLAPVLVLRFCRGLTHSSPRLIQHFAQRWTAGLERRSLLRAALAPLLFVAAGGCALLLLPLQFTTPDGSFRGRVTISFSPDLALSAMEQRLLLIDAELERMSERHHIQAGLDQSSLVERSKPDKGLRVAQLEVRCTSQEELETIRAWSQDLAVRFDALTSMSVPTSATEALLNQGSGLSLRALGSDRVQTIAGLTAQCQNLQAQGFLEGYEIQERSVRRVRRLLLDPGRAGAAGISAADLQVPLSAASHGLDVGTVWWHGRPIPLRLSCRPDSGRLESVRIGASSLGDIARIEPGIQPMRLSRYNRKSSATALLRPLPGREAQLLEALEKLEPNQWVIEGRNALSEQSTSLILVFGAALLLLFLLLSAQFESLVSGLKLMATILISICGSLLALLVCGSSINLNSAIGCLVMTGTAINVPINLLDALRQRPLHLSAAKAMAERLEGILGSTGTTLAALLPVLLSPLPQAAASRSCALALAGGLLAGLFCSLFCFPRWVTKRQPA